VRFAFILSLCLAMPLLGQTKSDVDFVLSQSYNNSNGVLLQNHEKRSVASVVLYPFYWLYKQGVSSQDGSMCSFHPSCANYGLNAVSSHGILGIFLAMDRVTRCHGIYPQFYTPHPSGLNTDEVY
jgi:putative component of membrane protein insertase Oxa1/YidC/SpoIIIJ protein YidD